MVKPEWGTRYTCVKCEARFYDLNKPEPICPKCGANQTKKAVKLTPVSPRTRARAVMPEEPEQDNRASDDKVKGIDGINVDEGESEEESS